MESVHYEFNVQPLRNRYQRRGQAKPRKRKIKVQIASRCMEVKSPACKQLQPEQRKRKRSEILSQIKRKSILVIRKKILENYLN